MQGMVSTESIWMTTGTGTRPSSKDIDAFLRNYMSGEKKTEHASSSRMTPPQEHRYARTTSHTSPAIKPPNSTASGPAPQIDWSTADWGQHRQMQTGWFTLQEYGKLVCSTEPQKPKRAGCELALQPNAKRRKNSCLAFALSAFQSTSLYEDLENRASTIRRVSNKITDRVSKSADITSSLSACAGLGMASLGLGPSCKSVDSSSTRRGDWAAEDSMETEKQGRKQSTTF